MGRRRCSGFLFLGVFAAACGAPDNPATSYDGRSVIVGDVDWIDVTTLDPSSVERTRTRAVGDLDIAARGVRCTGFLIARDVLITSAHCVPNAEAARGLTVAFARETGVPASLWSRYDCSEHIATERALDFTLLGCTQSPGDVHGVLPLAEADPEAGEAIYVVHGNCDFYREPGCAPDKKLSPGTLSDVGRLHRYDADTATGSSGAPVLSAGSHEVIAVHHAGYGPNPDADGRGTYTEGVAMSSVLPLVRSVLGDRFRGPLVADALEPNDDEPTVVTSDLSAEDLTILEDDHDRFMITLPVGGDITVHLDFVHADGDVDMVLGEAVADSADDDEHLALTDLAPGTYVLDVYGYAGAVNAYTIAIEIQDAVVDDFEPNEDGVEAPTVGVPFDFAGSIAAQDVDVFAVDHGGGALAVRLELDADAGDLDLHLYGEDGRAIGGSTGLTALEEAGGTFAAERIYVQVVGYAGATGGYRLQIR
ncbi:MAG: trypsin-like peptidase domain-containing protein [Deltaproteobacteria bacterium]